MQISTIPMESLAEILALQMENGSVARLVVTGDSMYPTLRHRKDVVYLKPVDRGLKRGDIILYQRNSGQYVLHRIVTKPKGDSFICCGDNQWEKEPMTAKQVIAIVEKIKRGKKTYDTENKGLPLRAAVWIWLFPVRRPLLAGRRFLGRLRRKFNLYII